jgi:hypothetical protein
VDGGRAVEDLGNFVDREERVFTNVGLRVDSLVWLGIFPKFLVFRLPLVIQVR